jgi:hypothetical protein
MAATSRAQLLAAHQATESLRVRHRLGAGLDGPLQVTGVSAIDGAADGVSRAKDLQDRALESLGHRAVANVAGDGEDLVEGDVAAVTDCDRRKETSEQKPSILRTATTKSSTTGQLNSAVHSSTDENEKNHSLSMLQSARALTS